MRNITKEQLESAHKEIVAIIRKCENMEGEIRSRDLAAYLTEKSAVFHACGKAADRRKADSTANECCDRKRKYSFPSGIGFRHRAGSLHHQKMQKGTK